MITLTEAEARDTRDVMAAAANEKVVEEFNKLKEMLSKAGTSGDLDDLLANCSKAATDYNEGFRTSMQKLVEEFDQTAEIVGASQKGGSVQGIQTRGGDFKTAGVGNKSQDVRKRGRG